VIICQIWRLLPTVTKTVLKEQNMISLKMPEPSELRVQSSISDLESTRVDEHVTAAITFYGETVFLTIINRMLEFDIECQHERSVTVKGGQNHEYVIESPVHGGASLGLINGFLESIQMSNDQTGLSELKAVTPTCDSSISVTIKNGRLSWNDSPLYWRSDSSEFFVKGEGFETLVRYLSRFTNGFNVEKLDSIVQHIEGLRRGGNVSVAIEGSSNNA